MPVSNRTKKNLETQGFHCDTPQFDAVEPWLRVNPFVCFLIAGYGLYHSSAPVFFALAVIAVIGVVFPHAPGDVLYNYGIRFITKTPALPPNPPPRRFACFVGTLWSIAIALAFLYEYEVLAYVLGIIFLLVIIPMMVWHFCIASVLYQTLIGHHSS